MVNLVLLKRISKRARKLWKTAQKSSKKAVENVSELEELLKSEIDGVRAKAAFTIGLIAEDYPEKVKQYIPDLISLLDHQSETVRHNAAMALGNLMDESALEKLEKIRKKEKVPFVKKAVKRAIQKIKNN